MPAMNNNFWKGSGLPSGRILFGVVGEENPNHPGVYRFSSTDGIVVNDAHLLFPDADNEGGGEYSRPRAGSTCVAVMTSNGAQCFIIGFCRPPSFDEDSDDPPVVGSVDDSDTSGDKVYRTAGDAALILKRGGAVILEGGVGTGLILNPINNQVSMRSTNFLHSADGYLAEHGRVDPGTVRPATVSEENYLHQVGPSYDRVTVKNGTVDGTVRRQLEIASVNIVSGQEVATVKTRETYDADGSWVGEGPKYQWGDGADEPAVLGKQLVDVMGQLIDIVKSLQVNTAWGPSGPVLPNIVANLESLKSQLSDKILSTFAYFSKNPSTP